MQAQRWSGLWRHRDFLAFWGGQTVSALGSQVTYLALPLVATLILGADAAQMGVLVASQRLPALLTGLPTGAWVDRLPKRPVLLTADLGRAILLLLVPAAHVLGLLRLEQLYVLAFLVGIFEVWANTAYSPFLVAVVSREQLLEAQSKLGVTVTAARISGQGVAGVLVQVLTAPIAIVVDALSFVVSACALWRMRVRETPSPQAEQRPRTWQGIVEGLRFVTVHRLLRALAGTRATWEFCDNLIAAILVLYLIRELGMSPGLLGLAFAGGPVGFLIGNLVSPQVARRLGVGPAALAGAIIDSAAGLGYLLVRGQPGVAVALLLLTEVVLHFGGGLYSIPTSSLRQIMTPDRLLGRMNASFFFLSSGVAPLGALAGGLLGQTIGLRGALAIGAVGEVAGCLWVWFSPLGGIRELPGGVGEDGGYA